MSVPGTIRAAAVLWWINGIGFGIFCIPAIREVAAGRAIPIVMGFPAYGHGPFERVGVETTVPLLVGFLVVCVVEVVAGALLWGGSTVGAIMSFVVLPFAAVYWWGFALPFGPVLAIVAVALTVAGWSGLR